MNYNYYDTTDLTPHFNIQEFRCKCGVPHDTILNPELPQKLEKLFSLLNCSKIIVNSGYRCSTHDKNVGGSGVGQHVNGNAADIVCYDKNGQIINSKKVCCAAQTLNFGGIANIDSTYTATHVDVRTSNFWKGDEVISNNTVTSDFFNYYGIDKNIFNTIEDKANSSKEIYVKVETANGTYSGKIQKN